MFPLANAQTLPADRTTPIISANSTAQNFFLSIVHLLSSIVHFLNCFFIYLATSLLTTGQLVPLFTFMSGHFLSIPHLLRLAVLGWPALFSYCCPFLTCGKRPAL